MPRVLGAPRRSPPRADARCRVRGWPRGAAASASSRPAGGATDDERAACLRSACRSCRRPACRPAPSRLERLGVARAARRAAAPRPVPTMIDIGVARPSAHGQAMMSTATALTSACARRGSGPNAAQTRTSTTATAIDGRHEPAGDGVGQPLDRRARCAAPRRPCRTICASSVSLPTRSRPHDEAAGAVHRAAGHRAAGRLLDRDRLAGHHRLVDAAAALEHDAVHRHLSPGRTRRRSPTCTCASGTPLRAVGVDAARRRGARPSSARIAALVRLRARSSSTWPSSTSVTMTAAASK